MIPELQHLDRIAENSQLATGDTDVTLHIDLVSAKDPNALATKLKYAPGYYAKHKKKVAIPGDLSITLESGGFVARAKGATVSKI